MTAEQRKQAEGFRDELAAALSAGGQPGVAGRHALVSKMLMTYPTGGASEEMGRARGEAYLYALEDVPAWAVDRAIRRWHRGDCGTEHDYRWAPAPATLRTLALSELGFYRKWLVHLESLLAAIPFERCLDQEQIKPVLTAVS